MSESINKMINKYIIIFKIILLTYIEILMIFLIF